MKQRTLRWIFYIWNAAKMTVFFGVTICFIVALLLVGLLQLDVTQRYATFKTNQWLAETFEGRIEIGSIRGLLPVNAVLHDIRVVHGDTLVDIGTIRVAFVYRDLFKKRIRVRSLIFDRVSVHADSTFASAFKRKIPLDRPQTDSETSTWAFELPNISIYNASLTIDTVQVADIELHSFAEFGPETKYVDISSLNFSISQWSELPFEFSGQIYQDERFLEFNAITLSQGGSQIKFGLVGDRFLDSLTVWTLTIDTTVVYPSDVAWVFKGLPDLDSPLTVSGMANGTSHGFELRDARIAYRNSYILTDAKILNFDKPEALFGEFRVKSASMIREELNDWVDLPVFPNLTFSGTLSGSRTQMTAKAIVQTGEGRLTVDADVDWRNGLALKSSGSMQAVDLSVLGGTLPSSRITGSYSLEGKGKELSTFDAQIGLGLSASSVAGVPIDTATVSLVGTAGRFDIDVRGVSQTAGQAAFQGMLDFTGNEPKLKLSGEGTHVNMNTLVPGVGFAMTDLDFRFQTSLVGFSAERVHGDLSVDVTRASIGGVAHKIHQLYVDLDSPDRDDRTLRFTSNVADATVSGDIHLRDLIAMGRYWATWLNSQLSQQFLFAPRNSSPLLTFNPALQDIRISVDASLKDLSLLNAYVPRLPSLGSRSEVALLVNATSDRLLINGGIRGDSIMVGDIKTLRSNLQVSAQFSHQSDLNEDSNVKMQLVAGLMRVGTFEMRDYTLDISLINERLTLHQRANRIGESTQLVNRLSATLSDSSMALVLDEFKVSNRSYVWEAPGKPSFVYDSSGSLDIKGLYLNNGNQVIDIEGRFSAADNDSVVYKIENLNLARLSELIGGRITFSGTLNATISSKSLTTDAAINGLIDIDALTLNNRLFGDVDFLSRYNPEYGRFDTRLTIGGETAGNNVAVDGYFYASDLGGQRDTTYQFDIDVKKADLWIINLFNKDLFQTIEGGLSGGGWLAGNFKSFDFDAAFNIDRARVVPYFLLTNYTASGPIRVSRKGGLVLNDLQVNDRFGGRGVVSGTLDFNDFKPDKDLNITMVMNNLQFLNNTFTPDVPFYGVAYGTGTLTLTGKTSAPFLQTRGQIVTSANSRMAIPFLDQTSIEEQSRFLEFVNSFDEAIRPSSVVAQQGQPVSNSAASSEGSRFVELFTLNLSFSAPPGSTVQLVFDPLTGEILNAQGSGSVQIRLEDQQFNVFGTFNVNQGDYTFVAGDIFLRKFELRDGGTLVWEGPADNARLNVLASYRSRPDISQLSSRGLQKPVSRVPTDLVLAIRGTLLSIENDFYFEFPNSVDITQNSTELAILNSEEQKLIQATSLLFTGGFIPNEDATGGQYNRLAGDLQSRGLNQLLSSQVNSLINSRLSFLDVDFNFSGLDQTDIGVAVRLFDDRLVLRGESQFVQGNDASLGDLGATFRINRAFSIELFHRRDPTLQAILGAQATEQSNITGAGFEAQVQFNTWRELRQRMWGSIRRFFSFGDENEPKSQNTAMQ
jgi:translocation and assembly module TamB